MKTIRLSEPKLSASAWKNVKRALDRSEISKGEYIQKFERSFSQFVGTKHSTTAVNGTMALYIALKALGVGRGDEVILPALTFAASADAIIMTGADPVFVDIDIDTLSLDHASVHANLTPKTKVIMAVDIYGIPSNVSGLRRFNLPILQDSCESLGATLGDADITCFSFYGNKVMTTGEGGMASTDSHEFKRLMDMYRNHGRIGGFWHELQGTNARMSNIAAALGVSQLEDLPKNLKKRWKIMNWYGVPTTNRAPWFHFVRVPSKDALKEKLNKIGIDAREGFAPLHLMPAYRQEKSLPACERLGHEIVLLPTHPGLTKKDVDYIRSCL